MKRVKTYKERLKDLDDMIDVQSSDGNWNYNDYMRGMLNGMEFSKSVMHDSEYEPNYKESPEKFLGEDKIMKINDFNLTKYNGTKMIIAIMEWLRVYNDNKNSIIVPIDRFLRETSLDRNKFLTFVSEIDKTGKVESFKVEVFDDNTQVKFYDFKTGNTTGRIWEESN